MWFGVGAAVAPVMGILFGVGLGIAAWQVNALGEGRAVIDQIRAWSDSMSGWLDPASALQAGLALVAIVVTVNVAVSLAPSNTASVRAAAATSVWSNAQTFLAVMASSCVLLLATVSALGLMGTRERSVGEVIVLIALALFAVAFAATIAVSNDSAVDRRRSQLERRRRLGQFTHLRDVLVGQQVPPTTREGLVKGLLAVVSVSAPAGVSVLLLSVPNVGAVTWSVAGIASAWAAFAFLAVWYLAVGIWTAHSRSGERGLTRVSVALIIAWHAVAIGLLVCACLSTDETPMVAGIATASMLALPGLYAALVYLDYRRRVRRWNSAWRLLLWPAEVIWDGVARGLGRRISGLHESIGADGACSKAA